MVPAVISSVRLPLFQMWGVAQLLFSFLSTRQICLPVFLSRASRKDWSSLSSTM